MSKRAIVIILDSVGVGALPDAAQYGDTGAATLQHVAQSAPGGKGLKLPTLQSLGLGNIADIKGVPPVDAPLAVVDKLATASKGKDTITGHWELMGVVSEQAFPTYPEGFPSEVMDAFVEKTGYGWLGNYPASGTEIIAELGAEHVATGKPIVYTSGDSVFQIAVHTDVIALEELYRMCQITRDEVLVGQHACARVIARPFVGDAETGFVRTADRHDYALIPPETTLVRLQAAGVQTYCIGKISDIFVGQGVDVSVPTKSNAQGMEQLEHALQVTKVQGNAHNTFIFANLVDFDMLWGHRRDYAGYAQGLEEFDQWLAGFLPQLTASDLLIITADHGCDPTHVGTDHTREYVPLMVYSPDCQPDHPCSEHTRSILFGGEGCTHDVHGGDGRTPPHYLYKVATIVQDFLMEG